MLKVMKQEHAKTVSQQATIAAQQKEITALKQALAAAKAEVPRSRSPGMFNS